MRTDPAPLATTSAMLSLGCGWRIIGAIAYGALRLCRMAPAIGSRSIAEMVSTRGRFYLKGNVHFPKRTRLVPGTFPVAFWTGPKRRNAIFSLSPVPDMAPRIESPRISILYGGFEFSSWVFPGSWFRVGPRGVYTVLYECSSFKSLVSWWLHFLTILELLSELRLRPSCLLLSTLHSVTVTSQRQRGVTVSAGRTPIVDGDLGGSRQIIMQVPIVRGREDLTSFRLGQ